MRDKIELYQTLNGQDVTITTGLPEDKVGSYFRLIENFVAAVDGDANTDIPTPAQALVSINIIDAIGRSAREGREIEL
jgi:predicted dehydrogenase